MLSDGNDSDSSDESFHNKKRYVNGNAAAKRKRTKRKSTKSKGSIDRFVLHSAIREDHKKPIYSVTFNPFIATHLSPVFATVGGRQLTIYECKSDSTRVLQVFQDPNETECFYTSAWGILGENPVIAFAGEHGSIRILSVINTQIVRHLIGHGSSINELHFHPIQRRILASASKDHTIRIWDVWSEVIAFILGGLHGHRDEVLSCDFRPDGELVASCGMDHSILVWNINSERAKLAIESASVFKLRSSDTPFPTVTLPPIFSTRDVHSNYIDCVRWFGDFILSKSCENEIKCWEPDLSKPGEFPSPPIQAMVSFEVLNCPNWYVRFGCDRFQKYMAVGNQVGKIFVWDMITEHASKPYLTLQHTKMTAQCRQCSFSPSGNHLVAVFDDATVWRFDFQSTGRDSKVSKPSSRESSLSSNHTPCSSQPMTPTPNGHQATNGAVKEEPEEKDIEMEEDVIKPKDEPNDGQPDMEEPNKDEPDKDEPDMDEPTMDEPNMAEPDKGEPDMDEPDKGGPNKDEPDKDEPDKDDLDMEEPDMDQPDKDELDKDESDKDEPDNDEPDNDKPDKEEPDDDLPALEPMNGETEEKVVANGHS